LDEGHGDLKSFIPEFVTTATKISSCLTDLSDPARALRLNNPVTFKFLNSSAEVSWINSKYMEHFTCLFIVNMHPGAYPNVLVQHATPAAPSGARACV